MTQSLVKQRPGNVVVINKKDESCYGSLGVVEKHLFNGSAMVTYYDFAADCVFLDAFREHNLKRVGSVGFLIEKEVKEK